MCYFFSSTFPFSCIFFSIASFFFSLSFFIFSPIFPSPFSFLFHFSLYQTYPKIVNDILKKEDRQSLFWNFQIWAWRALSYQVIYHGLNWNSSLGCAVPTGSPSDKSRLLFRLMGCALSLSVVCCLLFKIDIVHSYTNTKLSPKENQNQESKCWLINSIRISNTYN